METVAELVQTYRHDLEEAAEDIRRRGQALGESAPKMIEDTKSQIEPQTQELVQAVQDTSDVSPSEKPVIEVYAWSTIMVFFANVGIFLGIYILGPLVSVFVGKFGAAMLAFFGVPSYAHYIIKQRSGGVTAAVGGGDRSIRMEILGYAILQGVLTGYVIDSLYLSYIPFAVVTPAVIAASFGVMSKTAKGDRKKLLGGTVGAAVAVNFILGILTGSMSFVYLLLTLTYAGIAAVVMQVVLKNMKGMTKGHVYMNALSCGIIVAKGMFFLLFGSYQPEEPPKQDHK